MTNKDVFDYIEKNSKITIPDNWEKIVKQVLIEELNNIPQKNSYKKNTVVYRITFGVVAGLIFCVCLGGYIAIRNGIQTDKFIEKQVKQVDQTGAQNDVVEDVIIINNNFEVASKIGGYLVDCSFEEFKATFGNIMELNNCKYKLLYKSQSRESIVAGIILMNENSSVEICISKSYYLTDMKIDNLKVSEIGGEEVIICKEKSINSKAHYSVLYNNDGLFYTISSVSDSDEKIIQFVKDILTNAR